ncbi:MAG TPA: hypothetical protein VK563_07910 [Puia sp.]|nr:hypothetical protein [Puia sp.]
MEKLNDKRLSFGQRHWFLLCILVAILSPLVVYWVRTGARKEAYKQSVNIRPAGSDTSYKVAIPAGGADSGKSAAGDSSKSH